MQRVLHPSWTRRQSDCGVRRMRWAQSRGQELGRQHLVVVGYRHDHSLMVEMIRLGGEVAAGYDAQSLVLSFLESLDGGRGGVGEPDRSGVVDGRKNVCFIKLRQGLLRATPICP